PSQSFLRDRTFQFLGDFGYSFGSVHVVGNPILFYPLADIESLGGILDSVRVTSGCVRKAARCLKERFSKALRDRFCPVQVSQFLLQGWFRRVHKQSFNLLPIRGSASER